MGNKVSSGAPAAKPSSTAYGSGAAPVARAPPPKTQTRPATVPERIAQCTEAVEQLEALLEVYWASDEAGFNVLSSGAFEASDACVVPADTPPLPLTHMPPPTLAASVDSKCRYVHEQSTRLMIFLDTLDVSSDDGGNTPATPAVGGTRQARRDLLKRLHAVADRVDAWAKEAAAAAAK